MYLGRALRTKETLPDFRECRVGFPTSTSIPRVDRYSTDPRELGCHKKSPTTCTHMTHVARLER